MRKNTRPPSGSTSTVNVTTMRTRRTLGRYLLRMDANRPLARPTKAARGASAALSAAPSAAVAQLVSHAMERLDDVLAAHRLELGADMPDVAVDRPVGDLAVGGVDARNEAVAVAHVLGPAQEFLEERELRRGERDRPPRIARRVLRGI